MGRRPKAIAAEFGQSITPGTLYSHHRITVNTFLRPFLDPDAHIRSLTPGPPAAHAQRSPIRQEKREHALLYIESLVELARRVPLALQLSYRIARARLQCSAKAVQSGGLCVLCHSIYPLRLTSQRCQPYAVPRLCLSTHAKLHNVPPVAVRTHRTTLKRERLSGLPCRPHCSPMDERTRGKLTASSCP